MCACGSTREPGIGPFATGRAIEEFVLAATSQHDGQGAADHDFGRGDVGLVGE